MNQDEPTKSSQIKQSGTDVDAPPAIIDHVDNGLVSTPQIPLWRIVLSLTLLFLNYFLAQYDKFVLSYFQDSVISSLDLSLSEYGLISGYATGIVYALLALPVAFIADYTSARLWVLSAAAVWWSLCVIFQGLSHNFVEILLARIGMGIGQAAVEPLSVSLISDMLGKDYVFFGESILYVGVYIGEAVSGQIATAFTKTNTPWNNAMKAIGIVGVVVGVVLRLFLREPPRQTALIATIEGNPPSLHTTTTTTTTTTPLSTRLRFARTHLKHLFNHLLHLHSFPILLLSASLRQLAGNVFGYYMPAYLTALYPPSTTPNLLSHYGIIVGVVGSVSVLLGGLSTKLLWSRTKLTPLYVTAIGGFLSTPFVLIMIFSLELTPTPHNTPAHRSRGVKILYGSMSLAYLTAELWLGALNALIALLLPPRYKTFGLAIWSSVQVLIYSAGPEIIGLALRNVESGSPEYVRDVRVALAVIISFGYVSAGVGLLLAVSRVRRDLREHDSDRDDGDDHHQGRLGSGEEGRAVGSMGLRKRKMGFVVLGTVVVVMVVVLFVLSIVYR